MNKTKKYRIEVTEKQIKVISTALEEYFRLRMGQDMDFCNDLAELNHDPYPNNPNRERIFNAYIARRNHMREIMKSFFSIAFEPEGYALKKTEDMMIAEDIWDEIRTVMGINRWGRALHISTEPLPKIETLTEETEK